MKIPVNVEGELSQVINLLNISKFDWAEDEGEEEDQAKVDGWIGKVKWQL